MEDNYIFELEQALTKILDLFEPSTGDSKYILYDDDGDPVILSNEDLDRALAHANEILYGEDYDRD